MSGSASIGVYVSTSITVRYDICYMPYMYDFMIGLIKKIIFIFHHDCVSPMSTSCSLQKSLHN